MKSSSDNRMPPTPGPLADALRAAASSLQQSLPPPELKGRVLAAAQAAMAARGGARPAPLAGGFWRRLFSSTGAAHGAVGPLQAAPRGGRWAWSGAAACAAVLAGSALLMLRAPPGEVDEAVRIGGVGGGFLPLVPPERWPDEAAPAWLVSTELPGERLAALGLPYDPAHAGDSVRAELLLHPSGEVLAVRFLH